MLVLEITENTVLKPGPDQAISYDKAAVVNVSKGRSFPLLAYQLLHGHVHFTIDPKRFDLVSLHPSGRNTWWAFAGHASDPSGFGSGNDPKDEPPTRRDGHRIILPGFENDCSSTQPISTKAPNFTWGEALHVRPDGSYRHPENASVVYGIIRVAEVMQDIRERFKRPIKINSWYRDPGTNARVRGARFSTHMKGHAVDFNIPGLPPVDVYNELDHWWGGQGGLARGNGFFHIDCRGSRARWDYPGVR